MRCAAICCTGWSSSTIAPCTGRSRPVTARIAVDLPAPLAPSSATISPGRTSNETSSSTGAAPYPALSFTQDRIASRGPLHGAARGARAHVAVAEIGLQHARIVPHLRGQRPTR